ncbi:PREDICTED: P2Y purinoceptor 1-like [Cyprinodon variegatus]|uniref:P2Y purinoceptor 1-like n=1 Tax=Cyprinodon variegatus TaxID=28743 RepID=UPI0007427403|nr:PREDICTED: P2Y purinoceptor 1-like [Cyprinodon variegatus]
MDRLLSERNMTGAKCPNPDKDLFEHTVLPILYTLVFIIGALLNVWGLKTLLQNWKKLKSINILVFNLGLADVLYLLTLPLLITYYLNGSKWIFGAAVCKVTRFCFDLNLYCSIGFLTCLSVYRYLAIIYPLKVLGKVTRTHSVIISAMVWIVVTAQSLPGVLIFPKNSGNNTTQCFDTTDGENIEKYLQYNLVRTIIGFCIPFVIIVGSYGHVTFVVCHSNTIKMVTKQRSLKLLILMILFFSICYAPHHVFKNLNMYSRVLQRRKICSSWNSGVFIAHQAGRGLVSLNSALNPLVYLHVNEDMGAQFKELLQRSRRAFSRFSRSKSGSVPEPQDGQELKSPLAD